MIFAIQSLKKQKKALIISHYYQPPEIQDLADYVGDSFGMALFAQKSPSDLVVICGVRFMAETFKVMNPQKKILMPDENAGCSLADMCTPAIFEAFKEQHKGAYVVTYINSSLTIKTMSDVIVTSSNAQKIVEQIPLGKQIIFCPDQHLGRYVAKQTKRDLILFPGNCLVHTAFSAQEMMRLKEQHREAKIVAHPECDETVLKHADFVGSTSQMLAFTHTDTARSYIVMTEAGILHQMKKQNPHKEFLLGPDLSGCSCRECPHMRLNTLQKILTCLEQETPEVTVDPSLAEKARVPIARMMEMSV